jgi:flagellin-like protein
VTRERPRTDRGVSPAVGVVLMIAIVVALAALFGLFATGIDPPDRTPTNLAYDATYVEDGAGNTGDRPYVNITITGGREQFGDDVYVTDGDGNEVQWSTVWTGGDYVTAGEYVHIDGHGSDGALNHACHDEVYRVIRRSEETSEVIIQVTINGRATGAAATYC